MHADNITNGHGSTKVALIFSSLSRNDFRRKVDLVFNIGMQSFVFGV